MKEPKYLKEMLVERTELINRKLEEGLNTKERRKLDKIEKVLERRDWRESYLKEVKV